MSSTPPVLFDRNEFGLLEKPPIPYVYNDDGSVNWRRMIRTEFLVPNKQRTQETDVSKLEDRDLLILLGGIKELAQIRGFTSVSYNTITASPHYVMTGCKINWIGNYETNNNSISFEALSDASPDNTMSFSRNFLAAIAENRAFVRCVRNFLKINIVGQEEIGSKHVEELVAESPTSPSAVLINLMKEKNVSFEQVKKRLIKDNFENAEALVSVNDLPKPKIFELIEKIKSRA